ncbi:MAG: hypothetical protein GTO51_04160 [Candidatus Latescibacteria bacterium]|nr:hypothetical protein [Candidatus Latescibacterota bacterium]NIM21034.1 hypothetical protein [Candidatus Latescibacterota bacterium]NIM65169.1 hypothetical protein [Candidatus Latescibacterota bacterium]NIO01684.1 hypothetical protein [Candidatus Latescibacterota bacterium]NIO28201.1 hypothetical protein [Candidatus Latescibacterota bacterium]
MGKRRKKRESGVLQKSLLALSCIVLVLCAASIAFGFYLRHSGRIHEDWHPIRIEVLNGTGETGLAQVAADALMKKGIDVFRTGNAERFTYSESILIARRENPQFERLSRVLGCGCTVRQLKKNAIVDATLILGADYNELKLDLSARARLIK